MNVSQARSALLSLVVTAAFLEGCGDRGTATAAPRPLMPNVKSVSPPASVNAPPMARTAILPSSAMTSVRIPSSGIIPVGFTQLPGGAVFVVSSPDG